MRDKINVLVTGVNGGSIGEQIIKALRLSKKTNYFITATNDTLFSKALFDADNIDILPRADSKFYIQELIKIVEKYNIKVIIPGTEAEIKVLKNFKKIFYLDFNVEVLINNNKKIFDICFDKYSTQDFISKNCFHENIGYLKNIVIDFKNDDISEKLDSIDFFPCVIKPLHGSGSKNIFIIQNLYELKLIAIFLSINNSTLLIEEYVGDYNDKQEYTVGIINDYDDLKVLNSIVFKRIDEGLSKNITIPNTTNNKSFGDFLYISSGISQVEINETKEYKIVADVCEYISEKMGSMGVINIQCRYFNDKVYVMEINPRFSGTTCMRAMLGYNEPDLLIRKLLFDEDIEKRFQYKTNGLILRGLQEKMIGE